MANQRGRPPYVVSTFRRFHAVQAADALAKVGEDVVLLVPDISVRIPAAARLVRGSLAARMLEPLARIARSARVDRLAVAEADRSAARWLRRHGAAALHGFSLYSLESLRAAKELGIPCAVERSGAHIRSQRRLVAEERARLGLPPAALDYYAGDDALERMLGEYELADRIIVSSTFARDTFIAEGVAASKVVVAPLGANFPSRSWSPRRTNPFTVLFVGNELERKGTWDMLEAWRLAGLSAAELRLRSPILPRWAHLVSPSVRLLDPMPHAAIAAHFSEASVFCLLSVEDGFGMVVLEAMAYGSPVIVSRNVGARDVVRDGENGFVVDIRSPEAVAEKLALLRTNPELLQHMSRNALATACQYTWSRYAEEVRAMWTDLERRRQDREHA